jgi:YD repeat-containing protein
MKRWVARRHSAIDSGWVFAALGVWALAIACGTVQAAPTHYIYDELNRLVRVERADGVVVTYIYDALGNRLSKKVIHDLDFDNVPDAQDCAPMDATAFAVSAEIAAFGFVTDKVTLAWTSAIPGSGPGTIHDVVRGDLGSWPVGSGGGETCLAPGVATTTATDATTPAFGQGFWYLVRGRNVCGAGTYGTRSGGAQRVTAACP